jgi:D-3-phosphoglycerate dehydrogenase
MLRSILRRAAGAPGAAAAAAAPARTLKILAADPVDAICAQVFLDRGHKLVEKKMNAAELLAAIPAYDGLVVRSGVKVSAEIIAAGKRLRVIGRAGAGVDNIDCVAATKCGVVVLNTPGGNTAAAAELTMSLLMSLARSIPAACASLKGGAWERAAFSKGTELKGKTIGVIGLGQIGRSVARHCLALGMTPLGYDPLMSAEDAAALGAAGCAPASLEDIYRRSDFITVHTPLNDATRNLLCAATFAKCKKGVFIINAARGGIVNEADLLAALGSGQVRGAALDVYATEPPGPASRALLEHPAVLCTPHLGASTEEAQKKVAAEIAEQMSDAFENTRYVGCVNAPHLALASKAAFKPFVELAQALGALQGQVLFPHGAPARLPRGTRVRIELAGAGPLAEAGAPELLRAAVLRGLLPVLPFAEVEAGEVNLVNASGLAAGAGLEASAARSSGGSSGEAGGAGSAGGASALTNSLRVTVTPPGGVGERVAQGSIIDGAPRITQMDFWASFPAFTPSGHIRTWGGAAPLPYPPLSSLPSSHPRAPAHTHPRPRARLRSAVQQP